VARLIHVKDLLMFGWKKTPPIRTLVGEGTVITGEIRFTDGLRIDGEVHGNIGSLGEGRSLLVISGKSPCARQGQGWSCHHQRLDRGPCDGRRPA